MTDAATWYRRGFTFLLRGDYTQARQCFDKSVELNAGVGVAWHNKGVVHLRLEEWRDAIIAFEEALDLDLGQNEFSAWQNKGLAHVKLKQWSSALAALEEAVNLDANSAGAWHLKAMAHSGLKQMQEALSASKVAILLNPDHIAAWHNKGLTHIDLKEWKDARTAFAEVLKLDPDFAAAWNGVGIVHNRLKEWREALAAFDTAIQLDPKLKEAWHNKGLSHKGLKEWPEALSAFQKAVDLDANYATAWNGKGVALFRLGRLQEARDAYRRSIHLNPDDPCTWYNVGLLHQKPDPDGLDDPGMAQKAYVRSVYIASELGEFRCDALQKIQAMETAPLLVVRTHQEHLALERLVREPKDYTDAFSQCENFFQWWSLLGRDPALPRTFQLTHLGLEALALGDPVWAEQLFAKFVECDPESLFGHYSLARSRFAYGNVGAAADALQVARTHVETVVRDHLPLIGKLEAGLSLKDRLTAAEDFYYAGLILSMNLSSSFVQGPSPDQVSYQKARVCLQWAVKFGWHPARFALVNVLDACGDKEVLDAAIEDLLNSELELYKRGRLGFLQGVPHSRLSWEDIVKAATDPPMGLYDAAGYPVFDGYDPWELPGRAQATYTEIADALPFIHLWLRGSDVEPRDLPQNFAFVDLHLDVNPRAYREGWQQLREQSAWMVHRQKKVSAREIDALRDDLDGTLRRRYWRQKLEAEGLPSPDDAEGRAELEEALSFEIEDDRAGERAETHLKLIRYLMLRNALPARSAVLLSTYLGSCLSDDRRRDIASKCIGGAIGYPLGQVAGSMANTFTVLTSTAAGGLVGVALGVTGSILTSFLAERVLKSSDMSGRCSYTDFKTYFYDRLLDLRPEVQDQLKSQGLWEDGYDEDMDRLNW